MPFPYTDFSQTKKRPILILSNNDYISKQNDIVCCAITSQQKSFPEAVKVINKHMEKGHLKCDSWVLTDKLMAIEKSLLQKEIGKLNIKKSKRVADKVNALIEIEE